MIMTILKFIMGMKIGVGIWIGVGIFLLILIINILKGSFSIAKFAGGFNPFAVGVMGKLMYYAIILAVGFGIYHKITQETFNYDTTYKNNIHDNAQVQITQNVNEPQKNYLIRLQLLGLDLHFWQRGSSKVTTKITNKNTPVKIDQSIPKAKVK